MLRFRFILPIAAIALAHCGSTVPLANRPCPCSSDWTCCPDAKVCVAPGESCPLPPKGSCAPAWTATESSCVLDQEMQDDEVCRFPDAPTVQHDFDGDRDECSKQRDPEKLYRPLDCTISFGGKVIEEMLVEHGQQQIRHGRDRCRLTAALLMSAQPH